MGKWMDKIKDAKEPQQFSRIGPGEYTLFIERIYERRTRNRGDMHCAKVVPLKVDGDSCRMEKKLGDGTPLTYNPSKVGKTTDIAFWTGSNDNAMSNLMALLSCVEYGNTSQIFEVDPTDAEELINLASVEEEKDSAFNGQFVKVNVEMMHSKDGWLFPALDFDALSDEEKAEAEKLAADILG